MTPSLHRPRRLHNGSLIKSDDLELSNSTKAQNIVFNPIPMACRVGRCGTRRRVSNATVSIAASSSVVHSPLIQFTPKSSMHAFDNDQYYLQLTPAHHYLQQDTVTQISDEQATQIECDTKVKRFLNCGRQGQPQPPDSAASVK